MQPRPKGPETPGSRPTAMATTNESAREIDFKVVYYGPATSGKTTNIQYVYRKLDPATRGQLIAPTTDGNRTLLFDFLAVESGELDGYRARFHLYTVPGQYESNEARLLVLGGVDGVIFVVDSSADRLEDNVAAMRNLFANLVALGRDGETIPVILQYNKRDVANALPVSELEKALNGEGRPQVEAIATRGDGVFDALTEVSSRIVAHHLGSLG